MSPNSVNHEPPFAEFTTKSPPVSKTSTASSIPTELGCPVTSVEFDTPSVIHESNSASAENAKKAGLMLHPVDAPKSD